MGKGTKEGEREARAGVAVHVEELAQGHGVEDGLVVIHGVDGLTDGIDEVSAGNAVETIRLTPPARRYRGGRLGEVFTEAGGRGVRIVIDDADDGEGVVL